MVGTSPGFTMLISLNAPLALPRELYYRHTAIPQLYDRVVLLFGIALLWYWVGLNVESWNRRRTVVLFKWLPLRIAADLMLIVLGGFWGFVVINERMWNSLDLTMSPWTRRLCILGPVAAWSLALMFFFGHDFIQAARGRKPHSVNAAL
jgi:hypothetical protein